MKIIYGYITSILLISCYGINDKTTEIATLNTNYLSTNAWVEIEKNYSIDSIKNLKFIEILKDFEKKPFPNQVLYFNENPEELIAISTDHYSIRYVYNPKISNQILDGLSTKLSNIEKKRIHKRIQMLLIKYQSKKGKMESLKSIKNQ